MTKSAPNADALARYRSLLSPEAADALRAAVLRPPAPALRANPLKADALGTPESWAARYGWRLTPVPFCDAGWFVEADAPLSRTPEYRLGGYYLQDAASMLPAELFDYSADTEPGHDAESGPLILDLAASPGGKTTHLVSKIADQGLVIANDSSRSRIGALTSNLRAWSAASAVVVNTYGEQLGRRFPEKFDKALLDAPCSMDNLAEARRAMSPKEHTALVERQSRLLESALAAVRPGGEVVYATCTLLPDENEAVIDALLRRFKGSVQLKPFDARLHSAARGLTHDGEGTSARAFDPALAETIRLWPHLYHTGGFFSAALVKTASLRQQKTGQPADPPERARSSDALAPLSRAVHKRLSLMMDDFGFDLDAFLEASALVLRAAGKLILAVPVRFLRDFADLPYAQVGLLVAEDLDGALIPGHDLVARFAGAFQARRLRLADPEALIRWWGGKSVRSPASAPGLWLLEDDMGRYIGRGWVDGRTLRNLLPRHALR